MIKNPGTTLLTKTIVFLFGFHSFLGENRLEILKKRTVVL